MTDYGMDGGQWDALQEAMQEPDGLGPDLALACSVTAAEHVHARRCGEKGSRLAGRVAVHTHGSPGFATIYLAAPAARVLAAHLLNAADELDGLTPLVFFPRTPDEVEDVVEAEVVEDETPGEDA